jgi:hypothetical protein
MAGAAEWKTVPPPPDGRECWAIWQSEDALFAYDVEPFDLASPDLLAVITLLGFDPPS